MQPRRSFLVLLGAAAAGCTGPSGDDGHTATRLGPVETSGTTEMTVNTTAKPTTEPTTTARSTTQAPTPESTTVPPTSREPTTTDPGTIDISLDNETDETRSIRLEVRRHGSSAPWFGQTVTLDAGERRNWDFFSRGDSDTFVISVEIDDRGFRSYEWDLAAEPPTGRLTIAVQGDTAAEFSYDGA
jgi:hypothetical protein